jgi:hypothetical protein
VSRRQPPIEMFYLLHRKFDWRTYAFLMRGTVF